jgi:hypothetical protein
MPAGRPILITGSHRSGSSWCGRVIASSPDVLYVDEPFHLHHPLGVLNYGFESWFPYVHDADTHALKQALSHTVSLRYALPAQIRAALTDPKLKGPTGAPGVARAVEQWWGWRRARFAGIRPLIKDPIAVFSSEWIAQTFDAQVIVTVRHPAAFVHSILRAGWAPDFNDLLCQPELCKGPLQHHAATFRNAERDGAPPEKKAALFWAAIYDVVHMYHERNPSWHIVRNEDLAVYPKSAYEKIFNHLDLPFSKVVRDMIDVMTTADRPEGPIPLHAVRRDSKREAWKWRRALDADVVRQIREWTTPTWTAFYNDSDWTLPD